MSQQARSGDVVAMTKSDHTKLIDKNWFAGAIVGAAASAVISIIINIYLLKGFT